MIAATNPHITTACPESESSRETVHQWLPPRPHLTTYPTPFVAEMSRWNLAALVPGHNAPPPVSLPEGVGTASVCPPKLHDTVMPDRSSARVNVRLSPTLTTTRFTLGAPEAHAGLRLRG